MFSKTTILAAGLAALMSVGSIGAASAQGIQIGPDGVQIIPRGYQQDNRRDYGRDRDHRQMREISQRDAIRIAKRNGLREVSFVDQSRRAYEVNGFDRRSRDIVVVVDRRTGEVLDVSH